MTPSEYRYHIEKVYAETMNVFDWLLSDPGFNLFADMARNCKSGELVLENWKIFLDGDDGMNEKTAESYFEWWEEYRPDKLNGEAVKVVSQEDKKKKSPFDAVKKKVRMS